jgi:hypothetical protein
MSLEDRFKQRLGAVERLRREGEDAKAQTHLQEAVREYLNDRHPFTVASAEYGLLVSYNGYNLVALAVVAHSGINSGEGLAQTHRIEIAQALNGLLLSPAPARILVVRNTPVKAAVVDVLADKVTDVAVWTTDELMRLDLPLQG